MRLMIAALALAACAGPQPEPPEAAEFLAVCERETPHPVRPPQLDWNPPPTMPRALNTAAEIGAFWRWNDYDSAARQFAAATERRAQAVPACAQTRANLQHQTAMAEWRRKGDQWRLLSGGMPLGSALNPIYVAPAYFPAIPLR